VHWGCHYEAATVLDIGLILNAAALVAASPTRGQCVVGPSLFWHPAKRSTTANTLAYEAATVLDIEVDPQRRRFGVC